MNLEYKFGNSKWRIGNLKNLVDSDENWYSGVFQVFDYESAVKIRKFKMADPIWWTKCKIDLIEIKFITRGFSKLLIMNLYLKFRNTKWRSYASPATKIFTVMTVFEIMTCKFYGVTNKHFFILYHFF